jgi:GNAT superfamily N-acetyltransferase
VGELAMSEAIETVTIRPAKQDDIPFIFSSWLKSYRESEFAKLIRNDVFYTEHHALIDNCIKKGMVFCAVNKTDDQQIFGWISVDLATQPASLDYIYIKHPYRGLGIATMLMQIVPVPYIYTHQGKMFHDKGNTYNPYDFFRRSNK